MTAEPQPSKSSDRFAVVIRAAAGPPAVERMPGEATLLQWLYDRVECAAVDAVRLRIDDTELTAWVDDVGAISSTTRMNAQAMRLAAHVGRPGLILFGTTVVTGGPDPDGATLGLSRYVAERVASQAADTGRGVDRLIVQALLRQETPIPVVERVAVNLYWSRVLTLTHRVGASTPTPPRRQHQPTRERQGPNITPGGA